MSFFSGMKKGGALQWREEACHACVKKMDANSLTKFIPKLLLLSSPLLFSSLTVQQNYGLASASLKPHDMCEINFVVSM